MRLVSSDEAVASNGHGQTVFLHGGAATPSAPLAALAARAPQLTGVTTVGLHPPANPGPNHPRDW